MIIFHTKLIIPDWINLNKNMKSAPNCMKFCTEVLFIVTNRNVKKKNQKKIIFHGDPFSGDVDKLFYQLFLNNW